ncbi:GNAT family N-acetyltransferase [Legionella brunensis]|uniref:GNAT family acetyltransferase n=1 Tax=Legionella brunensis TaxID=29422 RepID=A0A0W0SP40_9GAMM|nr:GNAT family N-acetyltransferase [Legionella brunensis]KTC85070.1 GNAT family acetyltransferase [Legionella brunensis]
MVTIDLLKYHQDCIPSLANIWHEVLGRIWVPDVPIERVKQNFLNHLNSDKLPLTFVAFYNSEPVAMCSLRENDGIRPDLMPWLGSLVVSPSYQKQGIAQILINRTKHKAVELGFKTIYLLAFDPTIPDYYKRLGWATIGMDELKGHPVTVMETLL